MSAQFSSHWRFTASEVIARVLEEMKGKPEKDIREALRLAYPFGQKAMYPYRVWLDEIRRQMTGEKTSLRKPRDPSKSPSAVYRSEAKLRGMGIDLWPEERMTDVTELQRWCEGSEQEFGDASAAICQLYFRWVDSLLDNHGDLLVCGMLDGFVHLSLGGKPLPFPLLTDMVNLDAYCARRVSRGVYSVMPSLHMPGVLHAFVTLYEVPEPAPWERRIILPGEAAVPRGLINVNAP